MSYGADKWKEGDAFAAERSLRSARTMRFYALSKMLEAAELAARIGSKAEAIEHFRELQAHSWNETWRPTFCMKTGRKQKRPRNWEVRRDVCICLRSRKSPCLCVRNQTSPSFDDFHMGV